MAFVHNNLNIEQRRLFILDKIIKKVMKKIIFIKLSIIVPCFNEKKTLISFFKNSLSLNLKLLIVVRSNKTETDIEKQ